MPWFSTRQQLWDGRQVEPGELLPGLEAYAKGWLDARENLVKFAPEGHHIEQTPGGGPWTIVANAAESSRTAETASAATSATPRGRADPKKPKRSGRNKRGR